MGHLCPADLLFQLAAACKDAGVVLTNITPANLLLVDGPIPQLRLIDVGCSMQKASPEWVTW